MGDFSSWILPNKPISQMLVCEGFTVAGIFFLILKCFVGYRIFRTLFAVLTSLVVYKVIPLFRKPNLKKYKGRWTVVTGGTDGIGKAYTFELARRGLNKFYLIGRSQQKLDDVKHDLESKFGAKVQTHLFDFFTGDYNKLREDLARLDIGFVVNSVGVGREYLERYGDNPGADHQILKVNGLGATEFLSCVLPSMEFHGGGQIVVLSSSQGCKPIPLLAAYSAAKAMVSFIAECIDREYKTISVQTLIPALIATKMTYYEKGSLFVVTPENFVREAVNTIGLLRVTSGCFNHEFQMFSLHLFPWSLLKHILMPIYWHQKKRMEKLLGPPQSTSPDTYSKKQLVDSDRQKA
ncbi:hypothetical protein FO519_004267 [Halicephalobus sp. NKZ332]|nr:hypothetical protein FO519_004267 [Halicephalobus sp. NKZ332]